MSDKPKKIDFKKLFESFDDEEYFQPCKFCGRVVLAGWCCTKALEEAKKNAKPH